MASAAQRVRAARGREAAGVFSMAQRSAVQPGGGCSLLEYAALSALSCASGMEALVEAAGEAGGLPRG